MLGAMLVAAAAGGEIEARPLTGANVAWQGAEKAG